MGWISWLCPGMNLKRWLLLFTVGVLCCALGLALFFNYQFMGYVEELMFRMAYLTTGKYSNTVSMLGGFLFLCIGGFVMIYATRRVIRSVVEAVLPDNNSSLMEKNFYAEETWARPCHYRYRRRHGAFHSFARHEIYNKQLQCRCYRGR